MHNYTITNIFFGKFSSTFMPNNTNVSDSVEIYSNFDIFTCDTLVDTLTNADDSKLFSNSTLNTLDRWIGNREDPRTTFYTKEPIQATISELNGTPVVFADNHPSPFVPIEEGLKVVNGRIIGFISNARIVTGGSVRLMANVPGRDDPIIIDLYNKGLLGVSTGLLGQRDSARHLTKVVKYHHVLLFKTSENEVQRDPSALLNKEGLQTMSELEDIKKSIAELKEVFINKVFKPEQTVTTTPNAETKTVQGAAHTHTIGLSNSNPTISTEVETMSNETEFLNKEIEANKLTIASLNKELDAKKAEITDLTNKYSKQAETLVENNKLIAAYVQKEKDAKFASFLNTLKPGLQDTDDKKVALRNKFESDAASLIIELAQKEAFVPKTLPGKTGEEHVTEETNTENMLNTAYDFNPVTKKFGGN